MSGSLAREETQNLVERLGPPAASSRKARSLIRACVCSLRVSSVSTRSTPPSRAASPTPTRDAFIRWRRCFPS